MVTTRSRGADICASSRKKASAAAVCASSEKRARAAEILASMKSAAGGGPPAPPTPVGKDDAYERSRNERIRENLERMQKLGIFSLSQKLKSDNLALAMRRGPKSPSGRKNTPRPKELPSRRSSRLQDVAPVSYSERKKKGEKKTRGKKRPRREIVCKDEFYTEEYDKLLGSYTSAWNLFVDGYDEHGKRVYDPINGKTCHQCRQKTLGHRTSCCKCAIVQGQFCGDCLYLRYGENVLEANQNPDWICPVCRGICNCSLCRLKKGWAPTGPLAKRVIGLGFKSVAHYLIQTRRLQTQSHTPNSIEPVSAKRSLFVNVDRSSSSNSGEETLAVSDDTHTENNMLFVSDANHNAGDKVHVAVNNHNGENKMLVSADNHCDSINLLVSDDVHCPSQEIQAADVINNGGSTKQVSGDNNFSQTEFESSKKLVLSYRTENCDGVLKLKVLVDNSMSNDLLNCEGNHGQAKETESLNTVVTSSVASRSHKKRMHDEMESEKMVDSHGSCSITD